MLRVSVGCLGLFIATLWSGGVAPGEEKPARIPLKDAPPSFRGVVTTVSGGAVTIKPAGDLKITEKISNGDKCQLVEEYIQDNTQPPRTFVFNNDLVKANGRNTPLGQHQISDIQIGDVINITCSRVQGVDYCHGIEIHRRPGGRVPPAVGEDQLQIAKHRNAQQAREEEIMRSLSRLLRLRP